jgi:hypothetical protein
VFDGAAAALTAHANRSDAGDIVLGKVVDNVGLKDSAVDEEQRRAIGADMRPSRLKLSTPEISRDGQRLFRRGCPS